ncbi:MAG: zinc ribbon protein [Solirubrobacterales bacterium]|jgi:putative FmdB family regulatory protein|nr:zinc ribbon protein [Solirubrobacterales bacterium]
MPIYEYRRPDGTTFDVMQSFSDATLTHDPETGVPVTKVFHAPAIHFKGKGFHNTDYGTRTRNRELEKSAESGANDHSEKQQEKRDKAAADTGSSSSSSSDSGSSSSSASSDPKPTAAKADKPAPKKDAPKT